MIKNAKIVGVGIDAPAYHQQEAQRGTLDFAMSPSALKEFARCPQRWVAGYNPPGSASKEFGSLLDCRLLTPELFADRYAVKPPTYPDSKTGEPKPFNLNSTWCKEWVKAQGGREVVSEEDVETTVTAINRLRADPVIATFLDACDKQVMAVAEWHDEKTGLTIPIRCLMDLVPRKDTEFSKSLADLKTTRSAALIPFQRQCYQFGWHLQAAFDTDLYVAATGEDRCNWCFIVQESYAPWQPAKRLLAQEFVEIGRREYERHLKLYAACIKAEVWPGYDDNDEAVQGWSLVSPEPWMEGDGAFAPKLLLPETDTEESEVTPYGD